MASFRKFRRRLSDRISGFGKRTRKQLSELDDDFKRVGRRNITVLAKAQPFVTGAVTTGLSYALPGVGTILAGLYGTAEAAIAPYLGATAARGRGESGRDARDEGRDQRRGVVTAAGIGIALGNAAAAVKALLAPAAAPAAAAVPNASQAALLGGGVAPAAHTAAGGAAAAAAAAAGGAGGGILATLGSIGKTLLGIAPTAVSVYEKVAGDSKLPTGGFPGIEDLLALAMNDGAGAGAGLGAGEAGAEESAAGAKGAGFPTWAKVTAGGAVLFGGYGLYRMMRKGKAA